MKLAPHIKHLYVRGVNWALWRWMDIPDASDPSRVYLRRLILVKTIWFGLYLHWIYTTDNGRYPHDHPMSFISLVLRGGYDEEVTSPELPTVSAVQRHGPGSLHAMRRGLFHRITRLWRTPTITLVLTWQRFPDWGYLRPDGSYLSSKDSQGVEP